MRSDDHQLLERFIDSRDEKAFEHLVEKYQRLVFSTALRRLGIRELAEEATQNTFTVLARKSHRLRDHPTLGGWLHRTAMLEARGLERAEGIRRRKHAEHSAEMERTMTSSNAGTGAELPSVLVDEAMSKLSAKDRDVLVLRFYEGLSFDEIAARFDQTSAACQKRSSRALQKLAQHLRRLGLASPATSAIGTTIASGLANEASGAAASAIARVAVAGALQVGRLEFIRNTLSTMNYGKTIVSVAITLALLIPIALEAERAEVIEHETAIAAKQLSALSGMRRELNVSPAFLIPHNDELTTPPDSNEPDGAPLAEETDERSPIERGALLLGKLKREEIRYAIKYASGIPETSDENYAEYLGDMDTFMRMMAAEMLQSDDGALPDMDSLPVSEKVTFLGMLAASSLELEESQIDGLVGMVEESLNRVDFFAKDEMPDDPVALSEREAVRTQAMEELWDRVHVYLTPEQRLKMEKGFPKQALKNRSLNITFPTRGNTASAE